MNKIGMISLGCAKNLVNSEQMLYLLNQAGYEITGDCMDADAVVVNTCAFIESAKTEAIDTILELAEAKSTRGHNQERSSWPVACRSGIRTRSGRSCRRSTQSSASVAFSEIVAASAVTIRCLNGEGFAQHFGDVNEPEAGNQTAR